MEWAEIINDDKELKTVQFPDGSSIILNKNSKISYPKEFKERIVMCLLGAARDSSFPQDCVWSGGRGG